MSFTSLQSCLLEQTTEDCNITLVQCSLNYILNTEHSVQLFLGITINITNHKQALLNQVRVLSSILFPCSNPTGASEKPSSGRERQTFIIVQRHSEGTATEFRNLQPNPNLRQYSRGTRAYTASCNDWGGQLWRPHQDKGMFTPYLGVALWLQQSWKIG